MLGVLQAEVPGVDHFFENERHHWLAEVEGGEIVQSRQRCVIQFGFRRHECEGGIDDEQRFVANGIDGLQLGHLFFVDLQ
ncbi:hypothetical protein FQZ97_1208120 [compost metagenome]